MPSALMPDHTRQRLERILHPSHSLCKEDVIWILEYIKKKVADEDPHLLELSQPRLLKNFYYFAEVAMMLIHQRNSRVQELDRIKSMIREAVDDLKPV